jgi:hypothetical protein
MMARQVRPWWAKPDLHRERKARQTVEEPASVFHQGQRRNASHKVRMYGCNLYLLSKSLIESLAKREASMYV